MQYRRDESCFTFLFLIRDFSSSDHKMAKLVAEASGRSWLHCLLCNTFILPRQLLSLGYRCFLNINMRVASGNTDLFIFLSLERWFRVVGRDQLDRHMCVVQSSVIRNSFGNCATQCVWVVCLLLCDVNYQSVCTPEQAELCEKKPGRRFPSVQETPV